MSHMKKARNPRKAIIILSEGMAMMSSRYTESEVKNLVREAEVSGLRDRGSSSRLPAVDGGPRGSRRLGMLTELAESTRDFPGREPERITRCGRRKIGIELRNQYVLGYTPTNTTKDGK